MIRTITVFSLLLCFAMWASPLIAVCQEHADLNTKLLRAVDRGDEEGAIYLIHKGADPNFIYESGGTALDAAVTHQNLNMAKVLITHGAKTGDVLLYAQDYLAALELLKFGASLNVVDQKGFTPVDEAVAMDDVNWVRFYLTRGVKIKNTLAYATSMKMVKLLLQAGADVKWKDDEGTALGSVLSSLPPSDLLEVIALFEKAGANVADSAPSGTAIMSIACRREINEADRIAVFQKLVFDGAKPSTVERIDSANSSYTRNAATCAFLNNEIEFLKYIISISSSEIINLDSNLTSCTTTLASQICTSFAGPMWAQSFANLEMTKYLLSIPGFNPNIKIRTSLTSDTITSIGYSSAIVHFVTNYSLNPEQKNIMYTFLSDSRLNLNALTVEHIGVSSGVTTLVKGLIHHAVEQEDVELMQFLIDSKRADLNLQNGKGQTALDLTRERPNALIQKMLIAAGAQCHLVKPEYCGK